MNTKPNFDVDLVIPWVDGNDRAWQVERAKYSGISLSDSDASTARFRDWNLLQYVFRGIETNLPWIRKVHFITWGHLPTWLNLNHPKLNIVNHKDFIPSKYLPTFSSHPIELNIHRIQGLADHFIYSNDDIYFTNPCSIEDFFVEGLRVDTLCEEKLFYFKKTIMECITENILKEINTHFPNKTEIIKNNKDKWFKYPCKSWINRNYCRIIPHFQGFAIDHSALAFKKSDIEVIWENCPDILDLTCQNRFRNSQDVSIWLARYWSFVTGNFIPAKNKIGKYYNAYDVMYAKKKKELQDNNSKVICYNDTVTRNFKIEEIISEIGIILNTIFPNKSEYEL